MTNKTKINFLILAIVMLVCGTVFTTSFATEVDESGVYHTYHNYHGKYILVKGEFANEIIDKHFPAYTYDGKREWIVRYVGVGSFAKFIGSETGSEIITNSPYVKFILFLDGNIKIPGWICNMLDFQESELDME